MIFRDGNEVEYIRNAICTIPCKHLFDRGGVLELRGNGWPITISRDVQSYLHFSCSASFLICGVGTIEVLVKDILKIYKNNTNVIICLARNRSIVMTVISPASSGCCFWAACASSLLSSLNFNCFTHKQYEELQRFNSLSAIPVPDDIEHWFGSLNLHEAVVTKAGSLPVINLIYCQKFIQNISTHSATEVSALTTNTFKQSLLIPRNTSTALKDGFLEVNAGRIPIFQPSIAKEPVGFDSTSSYEDDLSIAMQNPHRHFQSFFNDQLVLSFDKLSIVNDDVINLPCFDEDLYCRLVREMHRFTIAEIIDKKEDLAKENANLGTLVGGLLGVFTFNPFAPFYGRSVGHSMTDKGKRVDEFLPDPNLLFSQDPNSFSSWSKAQVNSPRLRRLIINRQERQDGKVFFRLLPAIVTSDSIFPIQLFKLNSSTYFYRPFSAGIEKRNQPNYDCIKIQRRYFHLRAEGQSKQTDIEVEVRGSDVETHKLRLYRYIDQSLDYFYVDFKAQPGSVF
jgi:hypothetical protein